MAQTLTSPATAPRGTGHLSAGTRPEPEAARALAPAALRNCANAKKMPNRQTGADSCTGGRFTPHRVACGRHALWTAYAATGGSWKLCSAGMFGNTLRKAAAGPGARSGSDPAVPARIGARLVADART